MDYTTLKSTVTAQHGSPSTSFVFSAPAYGSTAINTLLSDPTLLKINSFVLNNSPPPTFDDAHQIITVSGVCAHLFNLANVQVSMTFFLAAGDAQVAIRLGLGTNFDFTTSYPWLSGSIFDALVFPVQPPPLQYGPFYVFCSAPFTDATLDNGTFVTGLNFWGLISLAGDGFASVPTLLAQAAPSTTAVGPIVLDKLNPGKPNIALALGISGTLSHLLPILKNGVNVSIISSFDPVKGSIAALMVTTEFDFGDHKSLEVGIEIQPWSIDQLIIFGTFTGIGLPSPSDFVADFKNLFGGADLVSSLPSTYHAAALSLETICVGLNLSSTPSISSVSVVLGNTDSPWNVDDFATLSDVSIYGAVQNPFASDGSRSWAFDVGGTLTVPTGQSSSLSLVANAGATIPATGPSAYEISGGLAPDSTLIVPLGQLLGKWLPSELSPTFGLSELSFAYQQMPGQTPASAWGFRAILDGKSAPSLTFGGNATIAIQSGMVQLSSGAEGITGSVTGSVDIFGVVTDFGYSMPGGFKMLAAIPAFDIDVPGLVAGLVGSDWKPPSWFPKLHLPQTQLYIAYDSQEGNKEYTFALQAKPSFGTICFQVVNSGGWAFAAGLLLDNPKIAAFDSLSFLKSFDDIFAVNELLFLFASSAIPDFQFPPSTSFGGTPGTNIAIPSGVALAGGFFFYGKATLNTTASPNLSMVQSMFGLSADLVFELQVGIGEDPAINSSASAAISGVVSIQGKQYCTVQGAFGIRIQAANTEIYVEGTVSSSINGTPVNSHSGGVTGTIAFALTADAAYLSVSMIGPVTFGPITISDVIIVVGIDDAEIPSVGFAAEIDLSAFHTTFDSSLAVLLDSGNPDNCLVAGAVSQLTLGDVITVLVGTITAGADAPPSWFTDVANTIGLIGKEAMSPVDASVQKALDAKDYAAINTALSAIGAAFSQQSTLIVGPAELGANGAGTWYITDYGTKDIVKHYELKLQDDGIHVQLEPQFYCCLAAAGVTLGPPNHGLQFNPGVFLAGTLEILTLKIDFDLTIAPNRGIAADVDVEKPIIIVPSLLSLTNPTDATIGPNFSLSTYSHDGIDPHLNISGAIAFIGLQAKTVVNIDSKGLLIEFSEQYGPDSANVNYSVNAYIDDIKDFGIEFSGGVHLGTSLDLGPLGTLSLNLDLGADLSFGVSGGTPFLSLKDCHFNFEGAGFTIPGFTINLSVHTLLDLPGILLDEVETLVIDFLKDPAKWLMWVGAGIIAGFESIEHVLENVFHALSSVWSSDRRVIVAVSESLTQSQSTTITLTPSTPTGAITQDMIDSANAWANDTLQGLVTQSVLGQLKLTSPDDVANFAVNSVQNIDVTLSLEQNQTWLFHPSGLLPTLPMMGAALPTPGSPFFTVVTTQRRFTANVAASCDFSVVQSVKVTATYANAVLGSCQLTSGAAHAFSAPWNTQAGNLFSLVYTVTYLNPSTLPVTMTKPLLLQGGDVSLLIPMPASPR